MVDGKVPAYPIFIHPDTRIDRSLLDNLLQIRSRADLEELGKLGGLKSEELQRSLTFQAKALAEHAADFLSGATSVFDDLDKLIKARVTADPQRVQLWFPEGTTQAEIDKAIEETEAVDGRVPIDVKFYRRPPPEKRR
jgi:hypothetical protein